MSIRFPVVAVFKVTYRSEQNAGGSGGGSTMTQSTGEARGAPWRYKRPILGMPDGMPKQKTP